MSWIKVQIQNNSLFSPRRGHSVVEYHDKVYVIGGETCDGGQICDADKWQMPRVRQVSDVWSTEDLVVWNRVTDEAGFGGRAFHASVVFQDAIWVFGGGSPDCQYTVENEIDVHLCQDGWFSSDNGASWTNVISKQKDTWWYPRIGHSIAVYDNRVWIFGGVGVSTHAYPEVFRDVWFNPDPAHTSWSNVPQDWCLTLETRCEVGWLGSAAALIHGSNNLMFLDGSVSFPKGGGSSTPGSEVIVLTDDNKDGSNFNVSHLHFNDGNQSAPWGAIGVAAETMSDDSVWLLGGSSSEVQWDYNHLIGSWSQKDSLSLLPIFSGTSKCSRFVSSSQTWETLPDAPWHGRHFHNSYYSSSTNRLYVIGGGGSDASSQYQLELYNDIWYSEVSNPSPSNNHDHHHNTCSLGSISIPAGCVTFGLVAAMVLVAAAYISIALVMHFRRNEKSERRSSGVRSAVMRLLESDGTSHPDDGPVLRNDDEDNKNEDKNEHGDDDDDDDDDDDEYEHMERGSPSLYKRRNSYDSVSSNSSRRKQKNLDFDVRLGISFS